MVTDNIDGQLAWKTVRSGSIPDDNNEATVMSVYGPEEFHVDVDEAEDYGNGLFVLPFWARVEALLSYYIFHSDYFCLPDERQARIGISEHNEHYYEAEEELNLEVEGTLAIQVNVKNLAESDLSENGLLEILADSNVTLDSIETMEVADKAVDM